MAQKQTKPMDFHAAKMQVEIDKYWDENNMGKEDIDAILNEHMRTPYRPFAAVPVLTGDAAKRFIDTCEYNSEHLSSSEYDKGRDEWVRTILEKRASK